MLTASKTRKGKSFTLIELLIVVAIIAILAAVAVPNFLEAQVRAKVARVRADMRSLTTALEAYAVDQNAYPQSEINGTLKYLRQITTPVAYMTTKDFDDPFTARGYEKFDVRQIATLRFYGFNDRGVLNARSATGEIFSPRSGPERLRIDWFLLFSHGPNGVRDSLTAGGATGTFVKSENIRDADRFVHYVYDSTNGSRSGGEIFRAGGSPTGATGETGRFVMGGG